MPVLSAEITIPSTNKIVIEGVSRGTRISYPFPYRLSLDACPDSGFVIFTIENQNFGLAARRLDFFCFVENSLHTPIDHAIQ